jgi:hypothetical protein
LECMSGWAGPVAPQPKRSGSRWCFYDFDRDYHGVDLSDTHRSAV